MKGNSCYTASSGEIDLWDKLMLININESGLIVFKQLSHL
jgi:hypothetical protein